MIEKSYKTTFSLFIISLSLNLVSEISGDKMLMLDQLPPDQRANIMEKMETASSLQSEIEEKFEAANSLTLKPELKDLADSEDYCPECIYGFNFFQYSPSTFAPVDNTPVTPNYVLGPGDKIVVNFYGSKERKVISVLNREGKLVLPFIGPINFLGMTYQEASEYLSRKVETELIGTDVDMSLSEIRSIGVYILGEAYKPGRYVISGLSSVSNALFVSGGVNEQGSLRNIKIKRDNEVISTYDFYDFLLNGSLRSDVVLQDGDVIFIPFIENSVILGGAFKRPHRYEIIEGETVKDAINLAGGYKTNVKDTQNLELSSIDRKSAKRTLKYLDSSVSLRDVTDDFACLGIFGPKSRDLLTEILVIIFQIMILNLVQVKKLLKIILNYGFREYLMLESLVGRFIFP